MSVRLQVRVPVPLAELLQNRANKNRRSISQEVEWLAVQQLQREGEQIS